MAELLAMFMPLLQFIVLLSLMPLLLNIVVHAMRGFVEAAATGGGEAGGVSTGGVGGAGVEIPGVPASYEGSLTPGVCPTVYVEPKACPPGAGPYCYRVRCPDGSTHDIVSSAPPEKLTYGVCGYWPECVFCGIRGRCKLLRGGMLWAL